MSVEDIPSGQLGNISKEQETCLRQMWAGILVLSGKGDIVLKDSAGDMRESSKIVNEIGAEKFHSALWASPVSDHPDLLVLRFLRARKWDVGRGKLLTSLHMME
jgi:hypothetical protein